MQVDNPADPRKDHYDSPLMVSMRECVSASEALEPRELSSGEVDIWHASRASTGFDRTFALRLLSEDENFRMMRFHFEKDRDNFLFARSMLRILLASYLGIPPAELRFAYSAHGKPSLAASSVSLEFNLSHSNGDVLIATCLGRKIGVDIESVRHDLDVHEIAHRFFSEKEHATLRATPAASRYDTFFACWTRKEAFVKARGEGLSCPLDSFDVSAGVNEEEVELTTRPNRWEARRWIVRSVNGLPGMAAAMAVSK